MGTNGVFPAEAVRAAAVLRFGPTRRARSAIVFILHAGGDVMFSRLADFLDIEPVDAVIAYHAVTQATAPDPELHAGIRDLATEFGLRIRLLDAIAPVALAPAPAPVVRGKSPPDGRPTRAPRPGRKASKAAG